MLNFKASLQSHKNEIADTVLILYFITHLKSEVKLQKLKWKKMSLCSLIPNSG